MSIRVLVVEDSAVVAEFLNHILGSDPALKVVGTVRNGMEALRAVRDLRPDVITMDINMPVMDGLEATRTIMKTNPVPIVIVSVTVDPGEVATTFRALEAGALAAVQKPAGIGHPQYRQTADTLVQTVKLMSEVKVVRRWGAQDKNGALTVGALTLDRQVRGGGNIKIVAMGASTGGPSTIKRILSEFPADFPLPVLIVQHISPGFLSGFAETLGASCKPRVTIPGDGEVLQSGHVYLAPDGVHMGVAAGGRIALATNPPENGMKPSISYLFRTVADVFGPGAAGVLLTGMGRDGADELKLMREKGAVTIAQDEASSIVYGMPAEAVRIGAATHVFSPDQIAFFLTKHVVKRV
jgi:two-component system, chemotaxis family, protein-glutamate methylesterase/glutaminase